MIIGLFHPGATVNNLEHTLAFYGNTLGMADVRSQVSDQPYLAKVTGLPGAKLKIGFVRLTDDRFPLEVIEYVTPKSALAEGGLGIVGTIHFCWQVENLPHLYASLVKAGVSFLAEPHLLENGPWRDWSGAFLLDPDRRLVELIEPPSRNTAEDRLTRFHHIGITCSNLAEMQSLLCNELGLKEIDQVRCDCGYLRWYNGPCVKAGESGILVSHHTQRGHHDSHYSGYSTRST